MKTFPEGILKVFNMDISNINISFGIYKNFLVNLESLELFLSNNFEISRLSKK